MEQQEQLAVHNVLGREKFPEVSKLSQEAFRQNVMAAFGDVSFFIGTTAVHGAEPQQIAGNVAQEMNNVLEKNGVDRKPIVLPFVPGHPIYGERNVGILREVYGAEEGQNVYLSEDLGRILIQTEFGLAGYQPHLENVRQKQPDVQAQLSHFINNEFTAISLFDEVVDGQVHAKKRIFNQADPITGERGRIIEINAGANVSAATEDGKVVAHSVFPNTLHGLMGHVLRNSETFNYQEDLVRDVLRIGEDLNEKFDVVVLPDIHPLGAQQDKEFFESTHAEAVITPPLKDRVEPPAVAVDKEKRTITISWEEDQLNKDTGQIEKVTKTERASNYDPAKGIVYLNVSGSGIGAAEAKGFVLLAQAKGYVVSVPPWLKRQWVEESKGEERQAMENVLSALPNILFAEDEDGNSLVKAQMLRAGLGAVSNSQVGGRVGEDGMSEGIAMIILPGGKLDNPETRSNEKVIEENDLGVEYTGQPNIVEFATFLPKDAFRRFNRKVYTQYGIPPDMTGMQYTANVLVQSEISRKMKEVAREQ